MIDPSSYSVKIQKVSSPDGEYFKGTVEEIPGIGVFESSSEAAYTIVIEAIDLLQKAAVEENRPFPEPVSSEEEEYSGRVTLRMPRWLHRQVDQGANRQGVSLNQHIVALLSASSSIDQVIHEAVSRIPSQMVSNVEKTNEWTAGKVTYPFVPTFGNTPKSTEWTEDSIVGTLTNNEVGAPKLPLSERNTPTRSASAAQTLH